MTYIEIEKDIFLSIMKSIEDSLAIVSGKKITTVKSMSNVPESTKTYCSVGILKRGTFGKADFSNRLVDEQLEYTLHKTITVQVNLIGDESEYIAGAFENALMNDQRVRDAVRSKKLGVLNRSDLRRAPRLRDNTEWVEGWNMDITFTVAVNVKYGYDWIEYITLNGEKIKIPYNE